MYTVYDKQDCSTPLVIIYPSQLLTFTLPLQRTQLPSLTQIFPMPTARRSCDISTDVLSLLITPKYNLVVYTLPIFLPLNYSPYLDTRALIISTYT